MENDVLQEWQPLPNLPSNMQVEAIHDDYEGFRILMRSKDSEILRICFTEKITYRNTDESEYLKIWGNDIKVLKSNFFQVQDSSFLRYFLQEMNENRFHDNSMNSIGHYLIFTDFDCIDILSTKPPFVEWI
jgi:hypothetical protein